MPGTSQSPIRVPLPGSGFMVAYKSQGERDRTLRLAEARQQIAHEGNGNPTWRELTDDERGTTELSARNWLRAAELAGLLAEQGQDDDVTHYAHAMTGQGSDRPRCGAPEGEQVALFAYSVTCPQCAALLAAER